jgi:Ca-activated chloride channel family protein
MFFRFSDPWALVLLVAVPLLGWWHFRKRKGRGGSIRFSSLGLVRNAAGGSRGRGRQVLFCMNLAALALIIIAMARPQSGLKGEEVLTEGVDIVLAMDLSTTMLAEDIRPNRVEAIKTVAREFIQGRKNDRIGLVVFAGEAYTQCPLTLDYGILLSFMEQIHVGLIEDGTAIGMGLATSVNRLRSSEAKSKVIVLLTDGQNNRGEIDPLTAAQAAQAFGIKVYTVGTGTRGMAMYPVDHPIFGRRYQPMPVNIDEDVLKRIADLTGGRYFRATDRKSLGAIYREIDRMEKTEIKVREYTRYSELFHWFAGAALILVLVQIVLAHTRYRKIP